MRPMPIRQETGEPNDLTQVLLFLSVVALQGLAALASALGCGDDGAVDYGTASSTQRRFCELVPSHDLLFLLLFSSPLVVFIFVSAITEPRSRWTPLLSALPFLTVTGLLPLALWINW